jgi:hypothetical protein
MRVLPALLRFFLMLRQSGGEQPRDDAGQKESVATYIEQTKLLVTLSSAFLLAPAGLLALMKDRSGLPIDNWQTLWFVAAELFFIASVLAGYVVLATIAGWQALGRFDIYRPATMRASLFQIFLYLAGLGVFIALAVAMARAPISHEAAPVTNIRIVP